MVRRQVGIAVWVAAVALGGATGCHSRPQKSADGKVHRVRLEIDADPVLQQKFSLFLRASLVGSGVSVVDSGPAEMVVRASFKMKQETRDYGIATVRQYVSGGGVEKTFSDCPQLSSSYDTLQKDFKAFDGAVEESARQVSQGFPNAGSLLIDSTSSIAAETNFAPQFVEALKAHGIVVISGPPAALRDRVDLEVVKVPYIAPSLVYKYSLEDSNGELLSGSGSQSIQAKSEVPVPDYCAPQLDFIGTEEPLLPPAREIAQAIPGANNGKH